MERNEIVKGLAPVSLNTRSWEEEVKSMAPNPTLTECLIVLEGAAPWRQDELTHEKALDYAFHNKNRLQELLERSYCLYHCIEEENRPDGLFESIQEALELL